MNGNDFLEMAFGDNLEYILVEFDPEELEDEELAQAVLDLQDQYRLVVSLASGSGIEVSELDFDLDD